MFFFSSKNSFAYETRVNNSPKWQDDESRCSTKIITDFIILIQYNI